MGYYWAYLGLKEVIETDEGLKVVTAQKMAKRLCSSFRLITTWVLTKSWRDQMIPDVGTVARVVA